MRRRFLHVVSLALREKKAKSVLNAFIARSQSGLEQRGANSDEQLDKDVHLKARTRPTKVEQEVWHKHVSIEMALQGGLER